MEENCWPQVKEYLFEVYNLNHQEFTPRFQQACKLFKNSFGVKVQHLTRSPAVISIPQPFLIDLKLPEILFCTEQDFLVLAASDEAASGKLTVRNMDQTLYEQVKKN